MRPPVTAFPPQPAVPGANGALAALPPREFVLIRHGQTDANRDGVIAGRLEAQLTDKGRAAARALAGADWPQALALYCSPQQRARETATLIFPPARWPGLAARAVEGLRERDWGRFEGRPVAEQPARFETPEGVETWTDLLARVHRALVFCLADASGNLPVLVAHSGVIRAARALTGADPGGPSPANTTPLLFRPTGGGAFLETPYFGDKDL